ncbi:MAG: thioredoxin domain-containing protein, partial [Planctomycetes bacterium]|nr:thioredoxin domain-containing protein [Planctomycetota bacterium]
MGTQSDEKPIPSPEDIERLPEDGGEDFNRLVFEQSPYLLQHARNPVDWHPWGDEALQRARELERPVFLSIGYSTCHWCHVMARESFENAEIAEVLNEDFVPVKVDREERPDIDRIYMDACQRITGQGGWPLTILMTPEGKPFFAGTYFPPGTSGGRQGLKQILDRISEMWENEREKVKGSADNITEALTAEAKIAGDEEIGLDVLRSGISELAERFDRQNGGFGSGQKFPSPQNLLYLLRAHHRNGDANTLEMVRKTLDAMRLGGMYDHVGGGFHRYATDPEWKVPHFEKMLYDQAMLLVAYSEGYQVMGKQLYADTIRQTIDFVNRDLRAADGGYYSALDAESEGEEGKFYVWEREEWIDTIGNPQGESLANVFNLTADGNYRDESTGQKTGSNI